MKFDVVVGNPPYQAMIREATKGNNARTVDIYNEFQDLALKLGRINSLIYPAKEYQRGNKTLTDKRLIKLRIYNGSNKDSEKSIPGEPSVFGSSVRRIPGDVGVFLWDTKNPTHMINFQGVNIERSDQLMPVRKELFQLAFKLKQYIGTHAIKTIRKCCESAFVEQNSSSVLKEVEDRSEVVPVGYTKVLTNHKAGSGGKAKWFYIKTDDLDYKQPEVFKVVIASAHPNEAFLNINNIEILDKLEMFGRTKIDIYSAVSRSDAEHFKLMLHTDFAKSIVSMTTKKFLYYLPEFNSFKDKIDWQQSVKDIHKQLCRIFEITEEDLNRNC